jgi:hypothetical protein
MNAPCSAVYRYNYRHNYRQNYRPRALLRLPSWMRMLWVWL